MGTNSGIDLILDLVSHVSVSEYHQTEEQPCSQHNNMLEDSVTEHREWSYQGENFKVDLTVTLFPILMLFGK